MTLFSKRMPNSESGIEKKNWNYNPVLKMLFDRRKLCSAVAQIIFEKFKVETVYYQAGASLGIGRIVNLRRHTTLLLFHYGIPGYGVSRPGIQI